MEQNTREVHLQDVNKIPMVTWRHLKMNGVDFHSPVPEILPLDERPVPPTGKGYAVGPFALSKKIRDEVLSIPTAGGEDIDAFVARNDNAGFLLRVDRYAEPQPIAMAYDFDDGRPALVDDTAIVLEEGSEATVIQVYRSLPGSRTRFHAGSTHVRIAPDAHLTLIQVQMMDDEALDFQNVGFSIAEGGSASLVHVLLGSSRLFAGAKASLDGDDTSFDLGCMYLADGSRLVDMNYVVDHYGKASESSIVARGALLDTASKMFRGTVDFKVGSSQSKGAQEEYSLMFSPKVHNRSVPLILCGEEDVEGAHAVSTGKIDEDALFYLMSRGLDEALAKKTLIRAQFDPIVSQIEDEALQDEIVSVVEERLESHEER